jgi:hypothetical protein
VEYEVLRLRAKSLEDLKDGRPRTRDQLPEAQQSEFEQR